MPRFNSISFYQNTPIINYFSPKKQSFRALGAPNPCAPGSWGICPQTSVTVIPTLSACTMSMRAHCSTSAPSTSITQKALCFESQAERFGARLLLLACWCWRFSHAQGMSQCYQIPAIKQQYSDYQTRQRIRRDHFEQNRLHQKNELHS